MIIFILVFALILNILLLLNEVSFGKQNKISGYSHLLKHNKKEQEKLRKKRLKQKDMLKSYIRYSLPITVFVFLLVLLLLKSALAALLASIVSFYYPKFKMSKSSRQRKEVFSYQFRELLLSVSNSLKAGTSLQVALERSLDDLNEIYKNKIEKPIIDELEIIVYEIRIGKSVEEALTGFKDRVKEEDVNSFVNAAVITSRTGGNLTEVMTNVTNIIGDKIQIKREIRTLTAAKRSEAKILTVMPVVLVLVLMFISPSYMEPMINNLLGKVLMVIGGILVTMNYIIGKKIVDIDV